MADKALEYHVGSRPEILDEDDMLVSAARQDSEAVGRLYDKYYTKILNYIYRCTFDSAVTEDLTSNVFLAALRHLERYGWQRIAFRAWLYRIATNEVRMHWRRQKRIASISLQADGSGRKQICELENAGPSAGDRLAAAEEYSLLHKALQQLRMKYRTVIILRYFEDKAIAEICEITGRREGTVKCQLHRGLTRLQGILERWGVLRERE